MYRSSLIAMLAAFAIPAGPVLAQVAAAAQTTAQAEALGKVEQGILDAFYTPMCEVHGYKANAKGRTEALSRAMYTAMGAGLEMPAIEKAMDQAPEREAAKMQAEMERIMGTEDDQVLRTGVIKWAEAVGERCARMAAEPAAMAPLTAPPGFDRRAGLVAASDDMLEGAGLASWQTPAIVAVGDFLYDVGACRQRLGARKAGQLSSSHLRKPSAKDAIAVRNHRYYQATYDAGVKNAREMAMTAEDCAALTPPTS